MRILLDSGIFMHSEFAVGSVKPTTVRWGNTETVSHVQGLTRKAPDKNAAYQAQIDALFAVGRLIREKQIEAYEYTEIQWEKMRGRPGYTTFNALRECTIHRCCPAVERTSFRTTADLTDFFAKGGKKDNDAGIALGMANQLAFFKWLCTLTKEQVEVIVSSKELCLTEFEVGSLKNIEWFQFLCERSASPENYPDVFHLWTAERNGFDAVLTLDNTFWELVSRVKNEKVRKIEIKTEVLQPLDLLQKLGIGQPDPVPIDTDRF